MNKKFPNTKFGTLVLAQPKSNIKAGEGKAEGNFPFFTSSPVQTKYLDKSIYQGPALIFGTGGGASVHTCEGPFATSTDCLVYYPASKNVYIKYLYRYLLGNMRVLQRGFKGAGLQHISKTYIENLNIPFPDIKEQKNIVKRLDKVQELITLQKEQLKKLDDLIKSRFIDLFGDPITNPKGWPKYYLQELCEIGSSKRVYQNQQSFKGIPFWRVADLVSKIDTGMTTDTIFIPKELYLEFKKKGLVPRAGDILVTSRGTLGKCYIVNKEDRFYFQDGMISWISKLSHRISPIFLLYSFSMSDISKQIKEMQKGATVAYLSIAMLKKIKIMTPDTQIQARFIDFVTKIEAQKGLLTTRLSHFETLYKSLVQEYFG